MLVVVLTVQLIPGRGRARAHREVWFDGVSRGDWDRSVASVLAILRVAWSVDPRDERHEGLWEGRGRRGPRVDPQTVAEPLRQGLETLGASTVGRRDGPIGRRVGV